MTLIGGRIFVIFWSLDMCNSCKYWYTLTGIAHTGILQELERPNFDKTRPACQWDDDSG